MHLWNIPSLQKWPVLDAVSLNSFSYLKDLEKWEFEKPFSNEKALEIRLENIFLYSCKVWKNYSNPWVKCASYQSYQMWFHHVYKGKNQLSHIMLKEVLWSLSLSTKRRIGWHQPSKAFFWHDTNYRSILCCLRGFLLWVSRVTGNDNIFWVGLIISLAKPSFGMTMIKILPPVLTWCCSTFSVQIIVQITSWVGPDKGS